MRGTKTWALIVLLASQSLAAQMDGGWCAATPPEPSSAPWFRHLTQRASAGSEQQQAIRVPVAFHVITDGRNGKFTTQALGVVVENLNWAFRDTPFSFYLYRVDTTVNKKWFNNCVVNTKQQNALRKRLAKDVRYYLNVYTCRLGQDGFYGVATFPPGYPIPGNPGLNYLQGVALDPVTIGGSEAFEYGLTLAHEVGHYLGLLHTFEFHFNPGLEACVEPGDTIADTAPQDGNTLFSCPIGRDSCPDAAGPDPITNFMNYATDACFEGFTAQQAQLMLEATAAFRPALGTR